MGKSSALSGDASALGLRMLCVRADRQRHGRHVDGRPRGRAHRVCSARVVPSSGPRNLNGEGRVAFDRSRGRGPLAGTRRRRECRSSSGGARVRRVSGIAREMAAKPKAGWLTSAWIRRGAGDASLRMTVRLHEAAGRRPSSLAASLRVPSFRWAPRGSSARR
jgi:hypothetical protein